MRNVFSTWLVKESIDSHLISTFYFVVLHHSDSCKGYVKIVKKCKKEKEALKPKVDVYNSIAIDCKLPAVKFEEVCIGNMPWYDDQLTPGKFLAIMFYDKDISEFLMPSQYAK